MEEQRFGDAGLRLLFAIQEACPETGIASGLVLGSEILLREYKAMKLQNQELQNENAKLKRNSKCAGCGHSKENHDSSGCLVWVEADAGRKCLCRVWTDIEKRAEPSQNEGLKCTCGDEMHRASCPLGH